MFGFRGKRWWLVFSFLSGLSLVFYFDFGEAMAHSRCIILACLLLVPCTTFLWTTHFSYRFALLWCDRQDIAFQHVELESDKSSDSFHQNRLKLLLVADPHVLGLRRSQIDREWTNWHIAAAYRHALAYAQPDLVLGLGDLLDEGRNLMGHPWWYEYAMIGVHAFNLRGSLATGDVEANVGEILHKPRFFGTVGNHDIGWRHRLAKDATQLFAQTVFFDTAWSAGVDTARSTGDEIPKVSESANYLLTENPLADVVRINSMALDLQADSSIREKAWSEIEAISTQRSDHGLGAEQRRRKPLILLTHMPLYRKNDLACGPKRLREGEGVTYKAPHESYIVDDEVRLLGP